MDVLWDGQRAREGTNVEQGMAILRAAPYPIIIADSLADAAI